MSLKQIIGCVIAVLGVVFGGLFVHAAYFAKPSSTAPEVMVTVKAGATTKEVAASLKRAGVVMGEGGYRLYGYLNGAARRPVAGVYRVQPGMSYRSLAEVFALGPARREGTARIIEGWTVRDEQAYLVKEKGVDPQKMTALMGASLDEHAFDPVLRRDFPFLQPLSAKRSLEGYLFPDTYRIWEDQLPEGLVRKQLAEFSERYATATVTEAMAPLKTLDEAVILASIVEKEVRGADERRTVAGIFLRRLREGMALQSDATLHYLTQSGRSQASSDDLSLDSPYNSYKYRGLPPGPIGSPGQTALDAVFNPEPTPYRYFLTDKEGNVLYGRTFEEHIQNRRRAGY